MSTSTDLTVRKTLDVGVPVEHAWEVFTARMGDWWPGKTHSPEPDQWVSAHVTADWIGETRADGTRVAWGSVEAFEPPHRLVIAWLVNPERVRPTQIEVLFSATATGTRVELTHSGFETYEDAAEVHASYDDGWGTVLDGYVAWLEA